MEEPHFEKEWPDLIIEQKTVFSTANFRPFTQTKVLKNSGKFTDRKTKILTSAVYTGLIKRRAKEK